MKLIKLTLAVLIAAGLASCSDKKTEVDNPDGPQGDGTMEVMTPDESKVFLENTAIEFLDKFNPEEQREMIELAAYFDKVYADCDAPANFDPDNDYDISRYLRNLVKAAQGDIDGLTRAAATYSYNISFERYQGVYTPDLGKKEWVKKASSNDIVFQFTNAAGQPAELKITQSGGTSDFNFTLVDDEWNNSAQDYVKEKYIYHLSVPKNVSATLTENGRQLATSTIISSIDAKGHKMSGDIEATLMNIRATGKISGTDSKIEARTEFYINNSNVGTAYATLEGSGLCDLDRYEQLQMMEEEDAFTEMAKMFKTADGGVDVLGKVQIYGQGIYYRELPIDLDGLYCDGSNEANYLECKEACERLNKAIKAQIRYNHTKTDQATLLFTPRGNDYGEYEMDESLLFPDGTTYSIEGYYDQFANVSGKFESVLNAYESIWKQARK